MRQRFCPQLLPPRRSPLAGRGWGAASSACGTLILQFPGLTVANYEDALQKYVKTLKPLVAICSESEGWSTVKGLKKKENDTNPPVVVFVVAHPTTFQ